MSPTPEDLINPPAVIGHELMRGVTRLRRMMADFFAAELPPYIDQARQVWHLEPWMLPYPVLWNSYDPLSANQYPSMGSYVNQTRRWTRVNINQWGEEQYRPIYAVRMFLWVESPRNSEGQWADPAYDQAMRLRDDLTALTRTCILAWPNYKRPGTAAMEEGSLTEDYLEPIKGASGASWLAGSILSMDVMFNESNYLTQLGTAETIDVDVQKMEEGTA